MLERLDQIDWSKLNHAYGSADDIPDHIRGLFTSSTQKREETWYELYGNLWHQGTVYEATAYAVPFLIELLEIESTPDKHNILSYLGTLAEGSSYIDAHKELNITCYTEEDLTIRLQQELEWVRITRDTVLKAHNVYLGFLSTDNPDIICATAYLLSRFPEHAHKFWPKLQEKFETAKNDDITRFGIAITSQYFHTDNIVPIDWLLAKFDQETKFEIKIALGISMLYHSNFSFEKILTFLTKNIIWSEELDKMFHTQPWDIGEPGTHIILALCQSPKGKELAVEYINSNLPKKVGDNFTFDYCYEVLEDELVKDQLKKLPYITRRGSGKIYKPLSINS